MEKDNPAATEYLQHWHCNPLGPASCRNTVAERLPQDPMNRVVRLLGLMQHECIGVMRCRYMAAGDAGFVEMWKVIQDIKKNQEMLLEELKKNIKKQDLMIENMKLLCSDMKLLRIRQVIIR